MTDQKKEFSEEDIQSTIKYLKTKNPENATRDDAIRFLEGMETSAHMIAHDIVDKEKTKKSHN